MQEADVVNIGDARFMVLVRVIVQTVTGNLVVLVLVNHVVAPADAGVIGIMSQRCLGCRHSPIVSPCWTVQGREGVVPGWEVGLVREAGQEGAGWVVTLIFVVLTCVGGPVCVPFPTVVMIKEW